ncbi:MAG: bifunctional phosphopantothenoylcysteine decarboxylase/phosphopantothenate--cysteine ligase CoaBC [Gammaproteobacteria bacterium]|nr:bifunctional phosphopantothenoylcysteine decarboxylase/phosphopantothenate--cysteine ligase CoaBC [Gammaproteobacteria bacterium]NIR97667.1 bifunctional phosphopantothenoylcysteine decarboxylase/phosphopantothenate--cysteine ligase CoaBC [Gammaproteobacteria bacterium]NIT63328.1 bifunctional phosphopantothenoylcysteine decarboxylase/phosphopantothenate--cysteine ligase CoaBC [Gammaproteobacteria bacterium]NIV20246.1 bifunctional phosphopantothenoylcysteine decarboxylase/phosphopantothenate--c
MSALANRRILLGVTGSIAAYKSADVVRRLRQAGAQVRAVLTAGGARFITPLTLQALSGHAVRTELLDPQGEAAMGHIELARWADAVMVAPASADFIARLAQGRADDLLAAICLATEAPLQLAPAMNQGMWRNTATRDNCDRLVERGVGLLGPTEGEQACGEEGPGRMLEPAELVQRLADSFGTGLLAGTSMVVTAGPTREPLDPVRFLGNRSSGKMGFAVARAAADAGARVTLIAGPVALPTPRGAERLDVETAQQMYEAVMARAGRCDIFVGAAAVADFRPARPIAEKLKKGRMGPAIELEPTRDILAAVAALDPGPFTVGFAAETARLEEHAADKLRAKKADMIAANVVGGGRGFERDENALQVLWPGGRKELPSAPKTRLARQLIELIAERYHAKDSA